MTGLLTPFHCFTLLTRLGDAGTLTVIVSSLTGCAGGPA